MDSCINVRLRLAGDTHRWETRNAPEKQWYLRLRLCSCEVSYCRTCLTVELSRRARVHSNAWEKWRLHVQVKVTTHNARQCCGYNKIWDSSATAHRHGYNDNQHAPSSQYPSMLIKHIIRKTPGDEWLNGNATGWHHSTHTHQYKPQLRKKKSDRWLEIGECMQASKLYPRYPH